MSELLRKGEKVIAEFGISTFKNAYQRRLLDEPQLTDLEREQIQLALDIAGEHSPFSVVKIIENERGQQYVTYVEPKLGE